MSDVSAATSAVRAGQSRYDQSLVELMKNTTRKHEDQQSTVTESKPAEHVGKHVDVKA